MKKMGHKFIIYYLILVIALAATTITFLNNKIKKQATKIDYSLDSRCNQNDAKYLNPKIPLNERVDDLLGRMTDDEKIGQMALVEKNSLHDVTDISTYNMGALLSGFGAKPDPNTPKGWLNMVSNFQAQTKNTCLKIPILYGVDAIHGFSNVSGATIFPHFIGLGATKDAGLIKKVAQATAEEMSAAGVYWNFSPNVDIALDTRWGRTYETFGSDPTNVSNLGLAYLQGAQFSAKNSYLQTVATVKHFVGNGATDWGSPTNKNFKIDQGNANISNEAFLNQQLSPFKKEVVGGAQVIMVGLNSVNNVKMSANKHLITDVLKKEMKFLGFVVSDWYGVYEISKNNYDSTVTAINSGVDMVMLPYDYKGFKTDMKKALDSKEISEERLNDAVRRILTVKIKLGLFERATPLEKDLSIIGSPDHLALARQAVRESQVLLKNHVNILPLSKSLNKIFVSGSGADNLGRQMGAWTVEWQGIDGNWVHGTTILAGIKNTVLKNTSVEYNLNGDFPKTENLADVGIAIVSEKPYAEGWGDNENPKISDEDLAAIKKLKNLSKKLIVIIVSGRPLKISDQIPNWDAAVASWLPGSQGQGVADVLFGNYPFVGKLPVKWNNTIFY